MAGAAEGDRAARDARGRASRSAVSGIGQLGAIQAVAPSFGMEVRPVGVRDAPEIERAVHAFARGPNDGLIVLGGPLAPASPRVDHHACRTAPPARGLLRSLLRRYRRPGFLWA